MKLFFLSSRKGRKKVRGRKPRKRGGTSENGTSKRLCVLTAIDRNHNLRLNITGIGNPTSDQITKTMDPWVNKQTNKVKKSIICTDGSNSYFAFERSVSASFRFLILKFSKSINNLRVSCS